jgi:hypothetical protein
MNQKSIVLLVVIAALLVCNGCGPYSPGAFFSKFSLEYSVKNNSSRSGLLCSNESMGSGGGGGGGGTTSGVFGLGRASHHKAVSFSCQINEVGNNSFNEAEFIALLRADVERQLHSSGAKVIKQGSTVSPGFDFEYSEGDLKGRINILGRRNSTNYYTLLAELNEESNSEAK